MARYLIDTNVLLRGAVHTSARKPVAVNAIAALLAQGDELYVAPQVLMEFWSVATRPTDVNGFGWSVEVVRGKVDRLLEQFPLLPETPAVFEEWLRLVTEQGVTGKRAHDTRLVALLKAHQLGHLLTFNVRDFRGYNITTISPDEIVRD